MAGCPRRIRFQRTRRGSVMNNGGSGSAPCRAVMTFIIQCPHVCRQSRGRNGLGQPDWPCGGKRRHVIRLSHLPGEVDHTEDGLSDDNRDVVAGRDTVEVDGMLDEHTGHPTHRYEGLRKMREQYERNLSGLGVRAPAPTIGGTLARVGADSRSGSTATARTSTRALRRPPMVRDARDERVEVVARARRCGGL